MDRRDLLKTGAVGVGLLGLDGCAHGPALTEEGDLLAGLDPRGVDGYLDRIDRRLAWIDEQKGDPLFPEVPQPCSPERQAEYDRFARLFKKSARTLYLTGCFLEASDELRAHPGMQARIVTAQGDMDEAVFETTSLLESLTPEHHREIRRVLRERPELGEDLAKLLDRPAQEDELPLKRRHLLRGGILDLTSRMRDQSPAAVIGPYVEKVRKIESRGPDAAANDAARLLASRIGEEAFWEHQAHMAKLSAAWQRKLAQAEPQATTVDGGRAESEPVVTPSGQQPLTAPPVPRTVAAPVAAPPRPTPKRSPPPPPPTGGESALRTGGHIMGFGAASVGVGLIFAGVAKVSGVTAFAYPAVFFGITLGPILLAIGLIVVLVGAIMIAAGD